MKTKNIHQNVQSLVIMIPLFLLPLNFMANEWILSGIGNLHTFTSP